MSSGPLVSIVIPTRDRCPLVQRAVRSALVQRGVAVEVIVVDDGSSDATVATLQGMAAAEPRLRVLAQGVSNGACAARNRGIAAASGKYYAGLDDDDELTDDHVHKLLGAITDEYALVASSVVEVYAARRVPNTLEAGPIELSAMLHYNRFGPQVLCELSRLREVGGFDERLPALQDYDLWVRLMARFGPALRTRDCTYLLHVEHGGPRISTSSDRRLRALALFEEKHGALLSAAHRKSMRLHAIKYAGKPIGLEEALHLAHSKNAKMILSMIINTHLPPLQRAYHRLRALRSSRQP